MESTQDTNQQQEQPKEQQAQQEVAQATEKTPEQLEKERKKKEKEAAKAANKAAKDAKKNERLAARQAASNKEFVKDPNDPCADKFGDRELNRSQSDPEKRYEKKYVPVRDLSKELDGQKINVRGRISNSRGKGNAAFLVIREQFATVQAALFKTAEGVENMVSKGMVTYATKIPKESIIDVVATVVVPEKPIDGCSQQVELQVHEIWTVNKSVPMLPFQIEDASRQVLNQELEGNPVSKANEEETKEEGDKLAVVKQDVRLNNRIIDLRVPTNNAIMRVQAGVCRLFREFLQDRDFIEIHSPKLIGGTSEGGANVFRLKYFGQDACLAQSPQLYKQMAISGDLQKVFEIGPVFRAENSNTNRHLCEFTGLDMEMEFKEHYFEVLDVLGELIAHICNGLKDKYARELGVINEQYPFEEFKCKTPVVKLSFKEGVQLLKEAGVEQDPLDDLSTVNEKKLGAIVREKYDTDFYMLYGYPVAARPFYTMIDPKDSNYTNSYDFFMRGEEITSGAQRIHDPELLAKRAAECGIPPETIKDYIECFKYGVSTHAGAGFGLERIVKFYCNLHNIRKCSLFPRDPMRITP